MARSFSQSLLAAAVAVVVGGAAVAQNTQLQEAVTLLRLNKTEEAQAKLREILTADPSSADALQLYQSVSQDEWYLLMTSKGEIQQIAQSILDRARVETKQRSRDEAAIAALVATATGKEADHAARQSAINKLIADHGEFAVPALVAKLGNPDDREGQIQAIATLRQMRSAAVLPLIEALKSSNELTVQNAAAALALINDDRAIPAMAHLASDDRAGVSKVARNYLAKKGVNGGAEQLLLAQSRQYLRGDVPLGGYSAVVWKLVDEKLVPTDVPALLYPSELAKSCAADASRVAPASTDARSALAQANLAQATLIRSAAAKGDEAIKALEPVAAELEIAALATGLDSLRGALAAGVQQNLAPVALGAINALAQAETADTIEQSTLIGALESSNKQVKYAAAEAIVRASGGVRVPQSDRVVAALGDAVAEESVRNVQVIAPEGDAKAAVVASSSARGFNITEASDAVNGMRNLLVNPNTDVVVINEILPDRQPEDVINNVKKDPRMADTRIVVIAKDVERAKARFGEGVGVVQAPLSGENLVAAVNTALDGSKNPLGERAEAIASKASAALQSIAEQKSNIDAALPNLGKQLNRGDHVAIPAARSLGLAGGAAQLADLVPALTGSGSVELKKAVAEGIGSILGRLDHCPADAAAALTGVIGSDADVGLRTAAATAIGKAKLDNQQKAELQKKLSRIAGAPAKGEG